VPCLRTLQQAVWTDRLLQLKFRTFFERQVEQVVAPYGLVAKANLWHLVYAWEGKVRVLRVSQVIEAGLLTETFVRPAEFDLAVFWEQWCAYNESRPPFVARVRVSPALMGSLHYHLEERFRSLFTRDASPDPDGWLTLDLPFGSFETARTRLLGLGQAVEVLEPETLRKSILDYAERIVDFYRGKTS
jgi:predicted DNA-binding transcriptional regulator YafY